MSDIEEIQNPELNFAEADAAAGGETRLFKNFQRQRFLVGYCKRDRRDWIMGVYTGVKRYAVRVEGDRQGSVEDDIKSYAADYLILYPNTQRGNRRIFPIHPISNKPFNEEEMLAMGYVNPRGKYIVFELEEEVRFEWLQLVELLSDYLPKRDDGSLRPDPQYLLGKEIYFNYTNASKLRVGLVDADLLDGGTRHPNLALLKIAGYLYDNNIPFELIIDKDADIAKFNHIYMSKVFTFTEEPLFYQNADIRTKQKFHRGGTGYYATVTSVSEFRQRREEDMTRLEKDPFLLTLVCKHSGRHGISMAAQMPYYHLYDEYVEQQVKLGYKKDKYKDYLNYSIGFLTRQCYRHCPFCVNKLENEVAPYSRLEWFYDKTRPHVYFWDDNFLAAPYDVWRPALQHLIDNNISFQFRQGLDERQLAESPYGEEMAEMLSRSRYHGDFIFAFDNWKDRDLIERALVIWKRHNPVRGTKFYLFTGFKQTPENNDKFYRDIWELFQRIRVLMQYGCVGYVMRHEDYHQAPIANFYVQVARWVNQQAFYKKMSFWEFTYRNQSYWEENTKHIEGQPPLITYEEFLNRKAAGYYNQIPICRPLQTLLDILKMFPGKEQELIDMFNYKMENLVNPQLWA